MTGRVIIVGGGIVGLSAGLALARAGWQPTIVDADADAQAASWGNAGHIAIEQVAPLASRAAIRSAPARLFMRGGALALPPRQIATWLPFALRMIAAATPGRFAHGTAALAGLLAQAMPAWRNLAAAIDAPDLVREDGHFVTWETARSAAAGRAHHVGADSGTARWRDADPAELAALARLGRVAGAIRFENSGSVTDLGRLRRRLRAAIEAAGGTLIAGRASLAVAQRRTVVVVDGTHLPLADRVLVTAGVRSGALLSAIGHRVPIVAERGYHLRSHDHDWPADQPPTVFDDRAMIVSRYADCVQVASFVELGTPDAPADPAKWRRLEAHVAALGLPIRGPFVRWMGARPTLPDYLPAIGMSRHADDLGYAFGHQHLGLTLAPVTAGIVTAMLAGRGAPDPAFDLDRFAAAASTKAIA